MYPSVTQSTTKLTWTDPGPRDKKPATNRLSHSTALLLQFIQRDWLWKSRGRFPPETGHFCSSRRREGLLCHSFSNFGYCGGGSLSQSVKLIAYVHLPPTLRLCPLWAFTAWCIQGFRAIVTSSSYEARCGLVSCVGWSGCPRNDTSHKGHSEKLLGQRQHSRSSKHNIKLPKDLIHCHIRVFTGLQSKRKTRVLFQCEHP
jgi:hypothetical protein